MALPLSVVLESGPLKGRESLWIWMEPTPETSLQLADRNSRRGFTPRIAYPRCCDRGVGMQDELVNQVANSLALQLPSAASLRSSSP